MADYKEGDVTWQGFLRPYADAEEAKAVFEKYLAGAKQDGAEIKTIEAEGADRMVVSVEHRPGRRRLPQGQHRRRAPTAPPTPSPPRPSPAPSSRACPANVPAIAAGK